MDKPLLRKRRLWMGLAGIALSLGLWLSSYHRAVGLTLHAPDGKVRLASIAGEVFLEVFSEASGPWQLRIDHFRIEGKGTPAAVTVDFFEPWSRTTLGVAWWCLLLVELVLWAAIWQGLKLRESRRTTPERQP